MKKKVLRSLALAAIGTFLVAGSAMALPVMTLNAGGDTVVIDDSVAPVTGDGLVTWSGALGDTFFTLALGSSAPATGTVSKPSVHITASVTSGTDLVTFELKDTFTNLDPSVTGWLTSFGGSKGLPTSDVTLNVSVDGVEVADYMDFGPDVWTPFVPSSDPYELVITGTIQAQPNVGTSFDANVSVPEPATLLLLGTGLVGLAGVGRRKN